MVEQQYYLCFKKGLNEKEYELVSKYWESKRIKGQIKFTYVIKDLTDILPLKSTSLVVQFVKDNCFMTLNSEFAKCPECNQKYIARTRSNIAKISRVKPLLCTECKKISVNAYALDELETIQQINTDIDAHKPEIEIGMEELENLSYINTLVLLLMALEEDSQLTINELNLSGTDDLDEKLLQDLCSKNALSVVKKNERGQINRIKTVHRFIEENIDFISSDTIQLYNKCYNQIKKPGINCVVPRDFRNFNEYKSYLFNKITNAKINLNDVKFIKEFVVNNRLSQAYSLVSIVRNTHKIPIEMTIKLNSVLLAAIKKYPLNIVHNILNYQAKNVASTLYSNRQIPYYIQSKLLPKYVENYMVEIEKSNRTLYKKRLPDFMVGSKIEDFTSYHIFGDVISWTDLSADQIIEKWMNNTSIQIE